MFAVEASSRARMTFWILPPESVPMGTRGPPSIPKLFVRPLAYSWILALFRKPALQELVMVGNDHVFRNGGQQARAAVQTIRGDVGHPPLAQIRRVHVRYIGPVVEDLPR